MAADNSLSAEDRDLLARTVYGEAADQGPQGQQAVAAVALNRLRSGQYGSSMRDVLLAPNQFEPWQTKASDLLRLSPNSAPYQSAAAAVDAAAGGSDPTNGATNFLNPELVKARGDKLPAWAAGAGQRIGQHVFYGGQQGSQMAQLSNSDLENLITGGGNATSDQGALPAWTLPAHLRSKSAGQSAADQPLSNDDLEKLLTAPPGATGTSTLAAEAPAAGAAPSAVPATPSAAQNHSAEIDAQLKALGMGAVRGVMDVGDTVSEGALNLAGGAEKLVTGASGPINKLTADYTANDRALRNQFDQNWSNNGIASVGRIGGQIAGSLPAFAAGGEVAGALGEAVPALRAAGAFIQGNKILRPIGNVIGNTIRGAVQGGTGAALVSSSNDAPLRQQLLSGAEVGGVAGPVFSAFGRALTKAGVPQEVARLADIARNKFNIPIGIGQISSNPTVRIADSVVNRLPLSGGTASRGAQQSAFNTAVAGTFGENANSITPDVMASAKKRIGAAFDDAAARTPTISADQMFVNDFQGIANDSRQALTTDEQGPIGNQIKNVLGKFVQTNSITGDDYQTLTRTGAPLNRAMQSSNPNIRFYAGQIKDALDGAMERSAPADVVGGLQTARSQWKAMRTVEDAAEKAPTGDISPALLMGLVRRSYSNMAYGGGGDLADLARIGQRFLKEPGSSNTAERNSILTHVAELGGAGGLGALAYHDPLQALAAAGGLAATAGVGRVAGGIMRSGKLANAAIQKGLGNPSAANRLLRGALSYGAPVAGVTANKLLPPPLDLTVTDYNHAGQ